MTNQREHILMVDDDKHLCTLVEDYLICQDFDVTVAYNGETMIQYLSNHRVDLIILDVMLPGQSGLSLAQQLRSQQYQPPIIMLSAAGEEVDRIVGLEVGADDYLSKPISLREMLAHVRAVLRRHKNIRTLPVSPISPIPPILPILPISPDIYTFGHFMLDTRNHCLTKENVEITITDADYNLLQIFVTHPNQILSRDKLMNLLKGFCDYRYNRCIDVRVRRLRKKIESNSSTPHYIRTVRNKGYLFTPQGKRT